MTTTNNTYGVTIRRWGFTLLQDRMVENLDEAKRLIEEHFAASNPSAALTYTFEAVITTGTGTRGETVRYYGEAGHRAYSGQTEGSFNDLEMFNRQNLNDCFMIHRNGTNDPDTSNDYEDAKRAYFATRTQEVQ